MSNEARACDNHSIEDEDEQDDEDEMAIHS